MNKFLLIIFCILTIPSFSQMGMGQYSLTINSRKMFGNNSDASLQAVEINKNLFKVLFKKGQKGIFRTSLQYKYAYINYKVNNPLFGKLNNFHNIGVSFSYIRRMNKKWSFIGALIPQLNSNFTDGIKERDFYINVIAIFNYSKTRNSRLSFGLVYTNTLGFPAPIPVVSYWKQFNDEWAMNLGFPRISLTHNLDKKSSITLYTELEGFNANISESIISTTFEAQRTAERISYRDIISGLEYCYRIKKFQLKLNAGYTINREFELQNSGNGRAYKFSMNNNFNLGIGLGFNF